MPKPPHLPSVQRDARALRDAGNAEAARNLLVQAIEAARPAYGPDHPDVLLTQHLLAQLHAQDDNPAAARRILEEALAEGQRRWGDADQVILTISYDLGTVAENLGNRHEARKNFTRVATHGPAVLGAGHWTVRAAREYLGDAAPPAAGTAESGPSSTSGTGSVAPTAAEPPRVLAAPNPQPGPIQPIPPAQATPPSAPVRVTPPVQPPTRTPPMAPLVAPPAPVSSTAPPLGPFPPTLPRSGGPAVPHGGAARVGPPPPLSQPSTEYGPTYPTTGASAQPVASTPPVYPTTPHPAPPAQPAGAGRSGSLLLLSVAPMALTVVMLGVGAVFLFTERDSGGPGPGPSDPVPVASAPPPTELRLRDEGTSITIQWTDPSGGMVSFIVAGARSGQNLSAMASVPAGQTSYQLNGLSARVDYCFTVLAVYGTDTYSTARQVCTSRGSRSPS